jgi:hypothetical protein
MIGSVAWWNAQPHALPNSRKYPGTACPKGFDIMLVGGKVVPDPNVPAGVEGLNPYKVVYNTKRSVRVGWVGGGTRRIREGLPMCVKPTVPTITSAQQAAALSFAPPEKRARTVPLPQPTLDHCTPATQPTSVTITDVAREPLQTGQVIRINNRTYPVGAVDGRTGLYAVDLTITGGSGVFNTSGARRLGAESFEEADLSVTLSPSTSTTVRYWLVYWYPGNSLGAGATPYMDTAPQGGVLEPDCGQASIPEAYRGGWQLRNVQAVGRYEVAAMRVTTSAAGVPSGQFNFTGAPVLTPDFEPYSQ